MSVSSNELLGFTSADSGPALSPRARREKCFEEFHAENPHIYQHLAKLAREARAAGCERIGIRLLWERLRWDLTVATRRQEGAPKLNDWYPPFYARLLMAHEADLLGIFETRGDA